MHIYPIIAGMHLFYPLAVLFLTFCMIEAIHTRRAGNPRPVAEKTLPSGSREGAPRTFAKMKIIQSICFTCTPYK